jgi:flagellar hook-associated protein 3 FlgL
MVKPVGVPDIVASARLGRSQAETKAALDRAQTEMATGEAVDRYRASGGDIVRVLALERSVSALDSRKPLLSMARSRAEGMQTSLEGIQTSTDQMGVRLLRDISTGDFSSARFTAEDAKVALGQVMGALNVELSGRTLFSGAAPGAPLAAVDELLADVRTLFQPDATLVPPDTGPLDTATIIQRVTDYFNGVPLKTGAPTFQTDIYRGSTTQPPPVELADGEYLDYAVRADAQPLRDMMRGLALAAITVEHFDGNTQRDEIGTMLEDAGKTIMKATDDITKMRSTLGLAEQRIDEAQTRTTAQRITLERARADLIGVDAYDAATRVSQLQTQLEAIYAMTARSTQLSLLNFLR